MNKIYRTVFNAATGKWAVASELAKGRKKNSKTALAMAVAALLTLPAGAAFAEDDAEEKQAIEQETAILNMAPNQVGTSNVGTMATLEDTYFKVVPSAVGTQATANGQGNVAIGAGANADTTAVADGHAIAIGSGASATGGRAIAVGRSANATGARSIALGQQSSATHTDSVALGTSSVTDRNNTVSVGSATLRRQITNVAAGTQATDAVNFSQLQGTAQSVATAIGGGSTMNPDGTITAPSFTLGDGNGGTTVVNNLGAAVTNLDGRVTTNEGDITNLQQQISNGTIGLVQQANAGDNLTVGAATDGAAVDFTGTAGERKLIGVADGDVSATSKEAINGSQLYTTNQQVAQNTTNITNLDGRVTTNEGDINQLRQDMNNLPAGMVEQAAAGDNLTVGKNTDGAAVDFTGTAGERKLIGVANGDVSATSKEAINGSQLHGVSDSVASAIGAGSTVNADGSITAPSFTVGDGNGGTTIVRNVGDAVSNLDGRVTTNEGDITNLQQQIGDGTIGLVQQANAGDNLTVGKDTDGAAVDFTGTAGERKLIGVANGDVSATSKEAINGSQLHGVSDSVASAIGAGSTVNADGSITAPSFTVGDGNGGTTIVRNVGDAVSNLDGRVTTNEGDITNLQQQIGDGTIGLVQQANAGDNLTVGKDTDGAAVDFTGTAGERKLIGVANGDVSATSKEAINGSQLHGVSDSVASAIGAGSTVNPDGSISAPSFTVGDGNGGTTVVNNVGAAVTNLDGRVTTNEGSITTINQQIADLTAGGTGIVTYDAPTGTVNVAAAQGGSTVDFTGTAGERKLIGVAAGDVSATSKEAINGSQLHGVSDSVATAIGAGSTVNPDGTITAPSFSVGDGKGGTTVVHNVGDAVTNLDGRVTTNEGDITNLQQQIGNGTIGLVQQANAGDNLTVGAATDGAAVDFTGTAGERKLIGVAAGDVSATSKEAINGSQLHGVSDSVASAIGAGSTVNPDGSISQPTFSVGDGNGGTTVVHNVGDAVTNLDGRMGTAETNITQLQQDVNNGAAGLVRQDATTQNVTVASGTGGNLVNFAGTAGDRRLTGVANGVDDNDAASIAQLKAMGLYDPNTNLPLSAVVYDGIDLSSVTFGGNGGTQLKNVAAGTERMDAVNYGQLTDLEARWDGKWNDLSDRVEGIENGSGAPGGPGNGSDLVGAGTGENSLVVGKGADASGSNSTATGNGSVASGDSSTAIGQGAKATHERSVAIGAGSETSRQDEVSFGAPGQERYLGNVKDGERDTDAVNVRQLNNAVTGLNNKVDSARSDAMGGVAAAMAVAGLPQSSMPGKTFMAIAGSTYGGEYGTAIGASYMTKDGKWVVKGAVNTSSRGEVGAVVGGGFYW